MVVIISIAGWINVEWDNEKRYSYHYGRDGIGEFYHVQVCNEPRLIPENVNIAVGCLVRKGKFIRNPAPMLFKFCMYSFYINIKFDNTVISWSTVRCHQVLVEIKENEFVKKICGGFYDMHSIFLNKIYISWVQVQH